MDAWGGAAFHAWFKVTQHQQAVRDAPLSYLLALPRSRPPSQGWPLILFLHGVGERGDDLALVARYGLPRLIEDGREFPFVVVSPQCPAEERWTDRLADLGRVLDQLQRRLPIDRDRVSVTGLSMGGEGAWAVAAADPGRFAALVPVCGRSDLTQAPRLRDVAVWALHGGRDEKVPVAQTIDMVAAIEASGGRTRATIYPQRGHCCWDAAYATSELYEWLLERRRPAGGTRTPREAIPGRVANDRNP